MGDGSVRASKWAGLKAQVHENAMAAPERIVQLLHLQPGVNGQF